MILTRTSILTAPDKKRVQKSLFTSHPAGVTPVLCSLPSEKNEATEIATEIRRAIAYTGGLLNYGDFAILREPNSIHIIASFIGFFNSAIHCIVPHIGRRTSEGGHT